MAEDPGITVYGAFWCPDCHRSKTFLGEHQIPYGWVDIEEDSAGEEYVLRVNDGHRRIPTINLGDGSVLTNPTNAELATRLGLKTTAERHHYDLIIVGGGPAGLTAAFYAAREGIDTLVIERAAFGGQAAATMCLENVPGFDEGISGQELSARLRRQAEQFGVELLQAQDVVGMCSRGHYRCLTTGDGSEYSALAVLITTGSRYRRLNVEGEEDFLGAGVHFCATCDGPFYRDRPVAVVGGGNSAAEESLFLLRFVESVVLLVRGQELKASQIIREKVLDHPRIDVRFGTEVERFEGEASKLTKLRTVRKATGEREVLDLPGVFVFVGLDPNTSWLEGSSVQQDENGFILTGHSLARSREKLSAFGDRDPSMLETSVPGIFAAGDVRKGSTKQVASAAGEGAAATLLVREYLKHV